MKHSNIREVGGGKLLETASHRTLSSEPDAAGICAPSECDSSSMRLDFSQSRNLSGTRTIIYRSAARVSGQAVDKLFLECLVSNATHGVRGVLFLFDGNFYQVLQGDSGFLDTLLERIKRDTRHHDIRILQDSNCGTFPTFSAWSIAAPLLSINRLQLLAALFSSADEERVRIAMHYLKLASDAVSGEWKPRVSSVLFESSAELGTAEVKARLLQMEDEADTANSSRKAFFSVVSHKLRTPMAGVTAAAHLLAHPNADSQKLPDYQARLRVSAGQLCDTVDALIDISRLTCGDSKFNPESFDLHSEIADVCRLFESGLRARNNQLRLNLQNPEKSRTVADRLRIRQMLQQLIVNADTHTSQGIIDVTLNVEREWQGDCWWQLSVQDTGCGIESKRIDGLFEPFSQGMEQSSAGENDGLGLGLATVRAIAERMSGRVGVQSTPGSGALFWVTFKVQTIPTVDETV